ncbi:MAG: AmmeMemoRadiSam system protein B [Candidatus Diapherotrites archaeon]|nr:AmmeMemoRadiSam system protein B [Candidatus Diapherotrites archaeon]
MRTVRREPVAAGAFYPLLKEELRREVKQLLDAAKQEAMQCDAGVAPHAGYAYSGLVAAHTFKALKEAGTYVLIGPDHTGYGKGRTCVYAEGSWSTPLGEVRVDEDMAKRLLSKGFAQNEEAHAAEHSIEVQLPFLQVLHTKASIVPIMMGDQALEEARRLGNALRGENCVVLASSDFSHYVPYEQAVKQDMAAIKSLPDDEAFYKAIDAGVSACGFGPIAAVNAFARPAKPRLLKYATSGDVTGDKAVVGYASIVYE